MYNHHKVTQILHYPSVMAATEKLWVEHLHVLNSNQTGLRRRIFCDPWHGCWNFIFRRRGGAGVGGVGRLPVLLCSSLYCGCSSICRIQTKQWIVHCPAYPGSGSTSGQSAQLCDHCNRTNTVNFHYEGHPVPTQHTQGQVVPQVYPLSYVTTVIEQIQSTFIIKASLSRPSKGYPEKLSLVPSSSAPTS